MVHIDHALVEQAVGLLKAGKLVAIPTETVYGLAADASNAGAVAEIFRVKGRPSTHPLIVHIADSSHLSEWAVNIPEIAYQLAEVFWPGPLTFVLKKAAEVPTIITGGQDTIAIRSPNHPFTQQILKMFSGGLAAPSANRFGHISPTTAEHVRHDLGDQIALIVDGGPCEIGIESTILDLTITPPRILRPGMITASQIADVLQAPVVDASQTIIASDDTPRVSGSLSAHYAPKTHAILAEQNDLQQSIETQLNQNKKIVVLARTAAPRIPTDQLEWIQMPQEPTDYARIIYQQLRYADSLNATLIIIEATPPTENWTAIKDRLKRATYDE